MSESGEQDATVVGLDLDLNGLSSHPEKVEMGICPKICIAPPTYLNYLTLKTLRSTSTDISPPHITSIFTILPRYCPQQVTQTTRTGDGVSGASRMQAKATFQY